MEGNTCQTRTVLNLRFEERDFYGRFKYFDTRTDVSSCANTFGSRRVSAPPNGGNQS